MTADVKITVVQRLFLEDVGKKTKAGEWTPCDRHLEGQEFLVDGRSLEKPEGFCSWAWCDLNRYVVTLARGGNFIGSRPGTTMVSCTDGYRPVIFMLERVEKV